MSSICQRKIYATNPIVFYDMLFTKEELTYSLMFKSPKSTKAGLDQERVAQLIHLLTDEDLHN